MRASSIERLRLYYRLTKPGIIYGNLLTVIGGYLFASRGYYDLRALIGVVIGTTLVIASACVVNNYLDRNLDRHMARTKQRALVTGAITARAALTYSALLGATGFAALIELTNVRVILLGVVAWMTYVFAYGWGKRKSKHGTLIGTIPGAAPLVAGYVVVTNRFDGAALLLFLIMVVWQMAHFYAIAIFRREDYAAAGVPVMSVTAGVRSTKLQIIAYVTAFIGVVIAFKLLGYSGYAFLIVLAGLGLVWLHRGVLGFRAPDSVRWAKGMFGFSLIIMMALSGMLALNPFLP